MFCWRDKNLKQWQILNVMVKQLKIVGAAENGVARIVSIIAECMTRKYPLLAVAMEGIECLMSMVKELIESVGK